MYTLNRGGDVLNVYVRLFCPHFLGKFSLQGGGESNFRFFVRTYYVYGLSCEDDKKYKKTQKFLPAKFRSFMKKLFRKMIDKINCDELMI